MPKARLVRPDGTVVESVDLRVSVSLEEMKAGRKCDMARCPLADSLRRFFGPYTTVMVDWDRIVAWPYSKAAVVECKTPPRLKAWMERYDMCEATKDLPKPLSAQFIAQLLYGAADRQRAEEWVARWQQEEPALPPPSESWRAQIAQIVRGGHQVTLDTTHPQQ